MAHQRPNDFCSQLKQTARETCWNRISPNPSTTSESCLSLLNSITVALYALLAQSERRTTARRSTPRGYRWLGLSEENGKPIFLVMAEGSKRKFCWIVVIGTSAGGMQALRELAQQLPADFPAPILIVQHQSPEGQGSVLVEAINQSGPLPCELAKDGAKLTKGHIIVARPDHHLLVKKGMVRVTKGARENKYRPAIDPLFRSAAVAYNSAVIAVILTGMLDDGTAGLTAVKVCGGTCIVQQPASADYPAMPQSALDNVKVDYCVPLCEMGPLLERLMAKPLSRKRRVPRQVMIEAKIAERVLSDVNEVNGLGVQVPYNCPNCGGVLWQITKSRVHRYRCHTGHSFTAASLEASQVERIEETLWICLRMLEERKNLLTATAGREQQLGFSKNASLQCEKAREVQRHIDRVREMLLTSTKAMSAGITAKH